MARKNKPGRRRLLDGDIVLLQVRVSRATADGLDTLAAASEQERASYLRELLARHVRESVL